MCSVYWASSLNIIFDIAINVNSDINVNPQEKLGTTHCHGSKRLYTFSRARSPERKTDVRIRNHEPNRKEHKQFLEAESWLYLSATILATE